MAFYNNPFQPKLFFCSSENGEPDEVFLSNIGMGKFLGSHTKNYRSFSEPSFDITAKDPNANRDGSTKSQALSDVSNTLHHGKCKDSSSTSTSKLTSSGSNESNSTKRKFHSVCEEQTSSSTFLEAFQNKKSRLTEGFPEPEILRKVAKESIKDIFNEESDDSYAIPVGERGWEIEGVMDANGVDNYYPGREYYPQNYDAYDYELQSENPLSPVLINITREDNNFPAIPHDLIGSDAVTYIPNLERHFQLPPAKESLQDLGTPPDYELKIKLLFGEDT